MSRQNCVNCVLEIAGTNVLVLRNPERETQIQFEKRAIALAHELAGVEIGDAYIRPVEGPDNGAA